MTPSSLPISHSPIIHHYGRDQKPPPIPQRAFTDPKFLAPEDAIYSASLAQRSRASETFSDITTDTASVDGPIAKEISRRKLAGDRLRPNGRRRKRTWKKLLWVKQKDYPDNYTDPPTFLSHLQRNPRLRPYDFWPLVADSTVIVQHISTVVIFVCSFVGIYQQRISPISVVSWGSTSTVLGWILWDFWVAHVELRKRTPDAPNTAHKDNVESSYDSAVNTLPQTAGPTPTSQSTDSHSIGLGLSLASAKLSPGRVDKDSRDTAPSPSTRSPILSRQPSHTALLSPIIATAQISSSRSHQRLATIKSAVLIYAALLGLSPILKSLTESTSSDSIWAMSCWLMCINILFFDYSGGVDRVKFPASLSTNAALMASTVLASRLPSTTHVFSLTLFSIEVFGLFPVFRRHLRHVSWRGHLTLTYVLIIGAGAALGLTISGRAFLRGGWKRALAGSILWVIGSTLGMGGCSWWLIGLQRYKNVVIGPWDPARPVLRGDGWD